MLARIGFGIAAIIVFLTLSTLASVVLDRLVWEPDPRPANVPDGATPIPYIAKTRLWTKCWTEQSSTRCTIYNGVGDVLEDDVFVTYQNRASVTAEELSRGIVPERSGADYLWLKSGTILVPQTDFETHRHNARVGTGRDEPSSRK